MAFSWPHVFKDGVKMIISGSQVMENLEAVRELAEGLPIGAELEYAGSGDPNATFLVEDGRELSRTTYATLFALLKTTYGAGNGTTTFNIPDCRGRISVGAGTGSGLAAKALAAKAGEETHLLLAGESGEKGHGHNVTSENAGGLPPETELGGDGFEKILGGTTGGGGYRMPEPGGHNFTYRIGVAPIGASNAAAAHNNMQPYIVKNKIIRVK